MAMRLLYVLDMCDHIADSIFCLEQWEDEAQSIRASPEYRQTQQAIQSLQRRKREVCGIVSQFERVRSDISVFHKPFDMNHLGYTQYCRLVYFIETLELEIDQENLDLAHMLEDTTLAIESYHAKMAGDIHVLERQIAMLERPFT